MKKRTLILAGAASFIVSAIAQMPLSVVTRLLPADTVMQLQGVGGTLWTGSVAKARIDALELHDLNWEWRPAQLFKGRLAASFRARLVPSGSLSGVCGFNLLGWVQCDGLKADVPAQWVQPFLQQPLLPPLEGRLLAELGHADWERKTLPQVSGKISWQGAGVRQPPVNLGQYQGDVGASEDGSGMNIVLSSDPASTVQLNGALKVRADGHYTLKATLTPAAGASADIQNALKFIGAPQPGGGYLLEEQGVLPLPQ